jgi:hypothetical protein
VPGDRRQTFPDNRWLSGLRNPYLDARETFSFNKAYLEWRGATLLKRLPGVRYQERDISGQAR